MYNHVTLLGTLSSSQHAPFARRPEIIPQYFDKLINASPVCIMKVTG